MLFIVVWNDVLVNRLTHDRLTTSIHRKPIHTDQYLAYDSHHPQSVKRGIIKCFYDCTSNAITKPYLLSPSRKKHLTSDIGYPYLIVQQNVTKTDRQTTRKEPASEIKSTAVLFYNKGVSESESGALRRCLQQRGTHTDRD